MSWRWSFFFPLQVAWQKLLLIFLGWMRVGDGMGERGVPACSALAFPGWRGSCEHRTCSSLPGEGHLWGGRGGLWSWRVLEGLPWFVP